MKKLFLLTTITCLFIAWSVNAQTVTVTTTGGDLKTKLEVVVGVGNIVKINDLIINGTLNASDFSVFYWGSNFVKIDLSGVTTIENKALSKQAFYKCTGLTTIVLPANNVLTAIGKEAFSSCTMLTQITIPDGVTTIGESAFYGSGIQSITLPNSVTTLGTTVFSSSKLVQITLPSGLTEIPDYTFMNAKLSSISIPESVKTIGNSAFYGNVSLTEITLPAGLETLNGFRTFSGCSGLTKLVIPANTQIVNGSMNETFRNCANLTSVNIPENVTVINQFTFLSCAKLESIEIPDNVTSIGNYAFNQCTALMSVTLGEGLTALNAGVFYNCSALTELKLPEALATIGDEAFLGMTGITTLELPAKVTAIGKDAFNNMTGLTALIVHNPEPIILSADPFTSIDKTKCTLYVPAETIGSEENDYHDYDYWKDFTIKAIGSDAVAQEIENFENLTVEKGAEPITLNATATGDRPVTYSIEEGKSAVATLQGNVLTIVGVGTAQLTASVEGDNDYLAATKTITLTVVDYSWLEEVAIAVFGNTVKVVGPDADQFTKIYVNDTEGNDLSEQTGELSLKAATSDGSEVIKLKINKQ